MTPVVSVRFRWWALIAMATATTNCSSGSAEREEGIPVVVPTAAAPAPTTPADADCAPAIEAPSTTLAEAFAPHFKIGAAVSTAAFGGADPSAAILVQQQFNQLSAENVLKWSGVHPQRDVYQFTDTDRYVEFGEQTGMQIHGHVLVWHQQVPDWVFEQDGGGTIEADALWQRLEEHITMVAGRYGGRIKYWDVVNEAFNDDGSLRDTPWRRILGDDYLAEVFALADRLLPDSRLVYNDYSMFLPGKRDAAIRLVKDLRERGIRIDAVGLQGHYNLKRPYPEEVESTLQLFAEAQIPVLITELDLDVLPSERDVQGADLDDTQAASAALNPYPVCLPPEADAAIAAHWGLLFDIFVKYADGIESITFWGVSDRYSWLNDWPVRGRRNYALLFDRELKPKSSLLQVLQSASATTESVAGE